MKQQNPIGFYLENGFKIIGENKLDLPYIKHEYRDMVFMSYKIQSR